MIKAADNILELVGNTPLVRSHFDESIKANIFYKLEYLNPGGSVKDRIGIAILDEAEKSGRLKPGGTIVEATSGNTGMGLAIAAAIRGYKAIMVMPDKMSDEKINSMKAVGAEVVICPTAVEPDDPRCFYRVAERLAEETENAILGNQYFNPENPAAHYKTTGPEIWEQTGGQIDALVACVGTGGTLSGAARYLKEQKPDIQIVAVDPIGSIYYEYFKTGEIGEAHPYLVEGFGEDLIPSTIDFDLIDEVVQVTDKESFVTARRLVSKEGVLAGSSSGGAVAGAVKFAAQLPNGGADKNIVVILPDSFSRYLSKNYNDAWMIEHGFLEASTD